MTPFPLGRPARMAVFASGRGTNLEALLQAFPKGHPLGEVVLVVSDNPEALALERARRRGVEALALSPREKPLYLRAWALLRAWGQEALVGPAFLGQGGEWGRGAFLAAHLLAEPSPVLLEEVAGLPGEVRARVEEALRVESSP